MEVILLDNVDKLGDKHTIVKVKDGYGRNYLIPQGVALIANATNRKRLNEFIKREEATEAKRVGEYQEILEQIGDTVIKVAAKAGASGKIFGSVTNVQLAAVLKEQFGIDLDRRKIILPEEVKNLGTYVAQLELHKEIKGELRFEVVED
jgi:large subunit ribosomal protein L9